MRQLTVVTKDRVGLLAEISKLLGDAGINISSVSVETVEATVVIRLFVEDWAQAHAVLDRAGFKTEEENVLVVDLKDRPGELAKLAATLASAGINIENMYLLTKAGGKSFFALKVDKPEEAEKLV